MIKVHIITFGCSLNVSDSETMEGLLRKEGFIIVRSIDEADIVIINSCTVKGPTELKVLNAIKDVQEKHKNIVVAGCLARATPDLVPGVSLLGPDHLSSIVMVVEETMNGNPVVLLTEENNDRLNLPRVRKNKIVEIIPISKGCLGSCSYCIVKTARGALYSYHPDEIIRHAKKSIRFGAKELWITAQDTGAYGKDIGKDLPGLLRELTLLEGDFKIRLGMANPNHVKDFISPLLKIFKHEKMFKFIHIPVQSGNDRVLGLMKREYSVNDFRDIVLKIREDNPEITLSTDVICGFPTETLEEFADTVKLIEEFKPDVLNISRFWARPGTLASGMEELLGSETKERSRQITAVFHSLAFEKHRGYLGREFDILVDEKSVKDSWVGRNDSYKPVIVLSGDEIFGRRLRVKVMDFSIYDLKAKIIR